ncbi:hypothetical protein [uncultured Demequina sp.]|uniref:DUF7144 family membrane protein n=1 Tax=uncultured Demequina sp. TaxID=693499 RepID=UPI0025DB5E0C|nr:hypothetical protein [uncultured Demequina sp.]
MTAERQGIGNMPAGVAFVAVLALLMGVATMALGGVWLWVSSDDALLGEVDTTASDATIYGWVSLGLGLVILLVAVGLFRRSRLSRFLVVLLMVVRIGADVFALIAIDGFAWVPAAIGIGWALLIILMLSTARATRYFLSHH